MRAFRLPWLMYAPLSTRGSMEARESRLSDGLDLNIPQPRRTLREWLIGSLDYRYMCMPAWPYTKHPRRPPHFYGVNDWLGVLTALIVGAQHCLAMVGGLIVPPLLVVPSSAPDAAETKRYLVQAAMIVTVIMTIFQVTGLRPLGRKVPFMWGAGVLSVMGVSFTTLPIASTVTQQLMADGKSFDQAYGALLGTLCVSTITPFFISLLPIKALRRIFPPILCGVTIVLIGIHLTGSGMNNWGGGAYCSANYLQGFTCSGNGDVLLPFGHKRYVGLGLLVFVTIILVEIFGSPFMRNCSAVIGLLLGYLIAAVTTVNGKRWVTSALFDNAPGITFIWTKTFPLSFYAPALIPLIMVFLSSIVIATVGTRAIITAIESVGDTTATLEASRLPTDTPDAALRVKGALFNDGVSGVFSALATSLPLTTFAQNNGIIALTNVASRQAGWACGFWLILLGILGKVGAFIVSIPNAVLGGMTTFLFSNVISSGIKIIVSEGKLDRRTRFIMASSLALGIGVELVPQWGNYWLWPVTPDMSKGVRGIRDAVVLILSTSFCVGAIVAFILNLIMPYEQVDSGLAAYEASRHTARTSTEDISHAGGKYSPSSAMTINKAPALEDPPNRV